MNETEFAFFLLKTLLKEEFHSKERMAQILGVEPRTLWYNFSNGENAKGASRASISAVFYCCVNGINIHVIFERFLETKKGGLFRTTKRSWMIFSRGRAQSFFYSWALRPFALSLTAGSMKNI